MKINKTDAKHKGVLVDALREAEGEVRSAIETFNAAVAVAWTAVEEKVADYNVVVSDVQSFVESVASDNRDKLDARSERYLESDKGQADEEWVGSWENLDVCELELEEPSPVDEPEFGLADELEGLADVSED